MNMITYVIVCIAISLIIASAWTFFVTKDTTSESEIKVLFFVWSLVVSFLLTHLVFLITPVGDYKESYQWEDVSHGDEYSYVLVWDHKDEKGKVIKLNDIEYVVDKDKKGTVVINYNLFDPESATIYVDRSFEKE